MSDERWAPRTRPVSDGANDGGFAGAAERPFAPSRSARNGNNYSLGGQRQVPPSAATLIEERPVAGLTAEWRWDNASVVAAGRLNARTRRGAPSRLRPIALVVLGVLLLSAVAGGIGYGPALAHDLTLAHDATGHLTAAESLLKGFTANPFDTQHLTQARQHFAAANADFTRMSQDLNGMPSVARGIPIAGGKLSSALRLLPIAIEATQAGVIACDTLVPLIDKLKSPFSTTGPGLTAADFTAANQQFARIQAIFDTAIGQISRLSPDDMQLDPRLAPTLMKFQQSLPSIRDQLQQVQTVLKVAPALLGVGAPANYLIEMMDSTELRPGGGFIGNYGMVTLSGGRLAHMFIRDVDLLDRSPENIWKFFQIPPQYSWFTAAKSWGLRDSNLDADFPTSAQNGITMYRALGGQEPLQGVVALTPWLIQKLMTVTGPIDMPEYKQRVTSQNLVDLIHYYQLGPGHGSDLQPDPNGHSSERKRFTEILFETFMIKVKSSASTSMPKLVRVIADGLRSKDMQIYLTSKDAETVLQANHAASAIQAPATGDSLLVVDANIAGSKSNGFMTYTMKDQVTLDASGTAIHHLTLTYNWPDTPYAEAYSYLNNHYYRDYLRIYVPPKSVLQSQSGLDAFDTGQAFGREVFSGIVQMWFPDTRTISLTWKVPGAAVKGAGGWTYDYLLQHQAGNTWKLNLNVALPSCGSVLGAPTELESHDPHSAFAQEPLAADYSFSLRYGGCA